MLTAGCVDGDHGASVIMLGGLYPGPAHQLNIPGQLFRVIPINPHYHHPILLHLVPDNLVRGIFSEQSFIYCPLDRILMLLNEEMETVKLSSVQCPLSSVLPRTLLMRADK